MGSSSSLAEAAPQNRRCSGRGLKELGLPVMAAKNAVAWYFEALGLQVDGLWRATEPYPAELPRQPRPPTMKLYRRLGQGWI
jgi:hypothetical protein